MNALGRGRLAVLGAAGVGLGWLGVAAGLQGLGVGEVDPGAADWIVVAGAGVTEAGQAGPLLAPRVDRAVDLWRAGTAPRILLTGGVGTHPPSEAAAAAARARSQGVPDEALFVEDRSTSTEENARLGAAVIAATGLPAERVVVVTDGFHAWRAQRVFDRHLGEVTVVPSRPSHRLRHARGAVREVGVVVWYAVHGWL